LRRFAGLLALSLSTVATAALAAPDVPLAGSFVSNFIPQLGPNARQRYKDVFIAIREARWDEAQAGLDSMPEGPLHNVARAELYLAKGSPKPTSEQLIAILQDAPYLPQAPQLARLARSRGIMADISLPVVRDLIWLGSAPRRSRTAQTSDPAASTLNARIQPLIKDNLPFEAEAVVLDNEAQLSLEGRTELFQRVAWSYFITGEDEAARRVAANAQLGVGQWAAQ
jgi:soluble lytic murein transglycosylase